MQMHYWANRKPPSIFKIAQDSKLTVWRSFLRMHNVRKNRPFLSCLKPLFQGEAKCEDIDMKTIFYFHANKTHFHKKGFAFSLVLKVRVFGTR